MQFNLPAEVMTSKNQNLGFKKLSFGFTVPGWGLKELKTIVNDPVLKAPLLYQWKKFCNESLQTSFYSFIGHLI